MTATFEFRLKPGTHDLWYLGGRRGASADGKHIRIVVLSRESCNLFRPRDRCAHARNLVGSDRHASARATHQYALFDLSLRHLLRNFPRVVRLIHGLFRHSAEIVKLNAKIGEQPFQALLLSVTSMIACECYTHVSKTSLGGV